MAILCLQVPRGLDGLWGACRSAATAAATRAILCRHAWSSSRIPSLTAHLLSPGKVLRLQRSRESQSFPSTGARERSIWIKSLSSGLSGVAYLRKAAEGQQLHSVRERTRGVSYLRKAAGGQQPHGVRARILQSRRSEKPCRCSDHLGRSPEDLASCGAQGKSKWRTTCSRKGRQCAAQLQGPS